MIEQEKRDEIIKGLECCKQWSDAGIYEGYLPENCENCPRAELHTDTQECHEALLNDALALLKAQEPVEPTIGGDADGPCWNWWYQCGKCKEAIDYHDRYCRNCGQAVKWDG